FFFAIEHVVSAYVNYLCARFPAGAGQQPGPTLIDRKCPIGLALTAIHIGGRGASYEHGRNNQVESIDNSFLVSDIQFRMSQRGNAPTYLAKPSGNRTAHQATAASHQRDLFGRSCY